ncbi:amidase [Speluncibacter jeojiensis]|uniref:amidase n=1 Tax=Speluncibacter jeojiensis TaxID=2710754 RepID=A0A9X4M4J3_9ACTN|nr:amidase [Corynebacteriales bacterium D3-21]
MTDRESADGRVHAFGDDALGEYDAVGLAGELRAGRISPTEAVDAAISRAVRVEPTLGAIACADFERARRAAQHRSAGFFAGVPTFVKDNTDVAGLPTQHGTAAFQAQPAPADGDFARTFFRLGVVGLGKSRLSEFGISPSAESPDRVVRNPWDPAYSSGASSAGSAALVASGVVPFAHGNDGGGSIRIPAAACGLVGLKPTRGRIPQDKMTRHMPVRVVSDGVLTRSVRDTATYLRETERLRPNPRLRPVGEVLGPGRRRLRIAMVLQSLLADTDTETAATVEDAARLLESMGHHVEEIAPPVPMSFVEDFKTYYGLLFLFLNATGKHTFNATFDWRDTESLTRGFAGYALEHAHRLPVAITRLHRSAAHSRSLYERYDVVLTPTVSHLTPRIGHLDPTLPYDVVMGRLLDWVGFTPWQNATGEPAISLPFGLNSHGTPIGVQLGGPSGAEARLLEAAFAVEEARPFMRIQDAAAG